MAVPGMTGGEQKPLLKFNEKTREFVIDDRVVTKLTMLIDLEHGETGWMYFKEGVQPDFRLVPMSAVVNGEVPFPPMPPDVDSKNKPLFKRGFRLTVKISDQLAAGRPQVREFASCSLATTRAIDKLHTAWVAERQDGKVPVVTVDGFIECPGQFGKNYEPTFKILKWIDRPADLVPPDQQPTRPTPPTPEPPAYVADVPGEPESFDEEEEADSFK
jgi:hypothetical protein